MFFVWVFLNLTRDDEAVVLRCALDLDAVEVRHVACARLEWADVVVCLDPLVDLMLFAALVLNAVFVRRVQAVVGFSEFHARPVAGGPEGEG